MVVDTSISNSKSHSLSRVKQEIQEEDPSMILHNETQINEQQEESQFMLEIMGDERKMKNIQESKISENSLEDSEDSEESQEVEAEIFEVQRKSPKTTQAANQVLVERT